MDDLAAICERLQNEREGLRLRLEQTRELLDSMRGRLDDVERRHRSSPGLLTGIAVTNLEQDVSRISQEGYEAERELQVLTRRMVGYGCLNNEE